jgi:hypothetical protein
MILSCYVDDRTLAILERAAREMDRTLVGLAEAAIAEAALKYERQSPEGKPAEGAIGR